MAMNGIPNPTRIDTDPKFCVWKTVTRFTLGNSWLFSIILMTIFQVFLSVQMISSVRKVSTIGDLLANGYKLQVRISSYNGKGGTVKLGNTASSSWIHWIIAAYTKILA